MLVDTSYPKLECGQETQAKYIWNLVAGQRYRVASLVVSAFGDIVLPRGGQCSISYLQQLLLPLNITSGALRSALSRLVVAGVLAQQRQGLDVVYSLSQAYQTIFASASARIYARELGAAPDTWSLCVVDERIQERRDLQRKQLQYLGYGALGATLMLRSEHPLLLSDTDAIGTCCVFRGARHQASDDATQRQSWSLEPIDAGYREFRRRFAPLLDIEEWAPAHALSLRLLAVHEYRRMAIKDPLLPAHWYPSSWSEASARETFTHLYAQLLESSEQRIDSLYRREGLVPPSVDRQTLMSRFA